MHRLWPQAVADYTTHLRAGGSPPTTIRLRRCHLLHAGAHLPSGPWSSSGEEITEWLASQSWAPETRRSYRASLRSFYAWAVAAGRVDTDPMVMVPRVRPDTHGARPAPEWALDEAIGRAGERCQLMIRLAAYQGLRRGEICQVHTDDVLRGVAGWSLRVHGKGRKIRTIPLDPSLARALLARGPGYVFPGQVEGHLSAGYVGVLMAQALPGAWTAHTLRHRFATRVYAGCGDMAAVQELLGHASIETTRRYVLLGDQAMRRALQFAA